MIERNTYQYKTATDGVLGYFQIGGIGEGEFGKPTNKHVYFKINTVRQKREELNVPRPYFWMASSAMRASP